MAAPSIWNFALTTPRERFALAGGHFLILSIEPGKTKFVRTSVAFSLMGSRLTPKMVQEMRGRHEVRGLILVEPEIVD